MQKIRWGYSKKRKAVWFYKAGVNFRGMCWMWSKTELDEHFQRCEMTNLEYLEGLVKIKEKLK